MAVIQALGTGSGLDLQGLMQQMLNLERAPKEALFNQRQQDIDAKLSGFSQLKSALSGFQDALTTLQSSANGFSQRTAVSADETLFTASASASAATGSYDIQVTQLAQAHKLASTGFSDSGAVVGEGTLTVSVGSESFSVTVDSSNNTAGGIRDAINQAADNTGVTATLVNVDDGLGGTETRLVLTADETGTDHALQISVADASDADNTDMNGLSQLATANLDELVAAQDAKIKVDTMDVTSSTNSVSGAIEGLTIDLHKADPGVSYNLSVGLDKQAARDAVNGFVDAYNSLRKTLNNLSSYDEATGSTGKLFSDSIHRILQQRIRSELGDAVSGLTGEINTLAEIGITSDKDNGTLKIDSARLDAALESDFDGIDQLFNADDGIATNLDSVLEQYLQSGGIIDKRVEGLNASLADINDQREALEYRLERIEARLVQQFSALDSLLGQLNSTSSFLTNQLAGLPQPNSGNGS